MVHGHPRKVGSKTDKPKGSVIKCYPFKPGSETSEANAKRKADAQHYAIMMSEQKG